MIKHIILWKLKDTLNEDEKKEVKAGIKAGLEGLLGVVPGLTAIQVRTTGLSSSTADVMLDSAFTDAAALKNYSVHPAHTAVADAKVRPFTQTRLCLDFEE
ncbi:MAG: Dabb family protein [Lentisphaeria bacterium]|nr:Dabb family protein [Lentisphaeria bacterium]